MARTHALVSLLLLALLPLAVPAAQAASNTVPPSAPLNLVADTAGGSAQVALRWEAPEVPGSPHFNRYDVLRGDAGAPPALVATLPSNTTAFTDSGLSPGVSYTYQVQAASKKATGPASDPVSAETGPQPPSAPTNLAASLEEGPIVHLTWTPPANTPANPVDGQTVYRVTQGETGSYGLANLPPDASSWDDDTATAGSAYTYHVMAYGGGNGGPSASLEVVIPAELAGTAPSAPRDLTAAVARDCVHLAWSAPGWAGTGGFWGYTVHRARDDDTFVPLVATAATEFTECGLGPLTTYRYAISAQNRYGDSPLSDSVEATIVIPQAPNPATGLSGTAAGPEGPVTLTWTPPVATAERPVDGQTVHRTFVGREEFWDAIGFLGADDSSWEDTWNLQAGTTYIYRIMAYNQEAGSYSEPATVEVPSYAPGAPEALAATAGPGVGEIRLAWQPPAHDGGYQVTLYEVYATAQGNDESLVGMTQLGDGEGFLSFTDTGLQPGETRTYRVAAQNLAGLGPKSAPATASAFDTPSAPVGVAARPGVLGADISWQAPDDDGGLPVLTYTVYRSVAGGEPVAVATVDGSLGTLHDGGCALLQSCEYRVTAANLVGEGDLSDRATTLGTALPR